MLIRVIIFTAMFAILFSLGSALYYLLNKKQAGGQIAKALTLRIGFSLGLFILLLIAFSMGWINPHGV